MHNLKDIFSCATSPSWFISESRMPLRLVLPIRPARPATSGCLTRTHRTQQHAGQNGQAPQEKVGAGRGRATVGFHPDQNLFRSPKCAFLTESQFFTLMLGYDLT